MPRRLEACTKPSEGTTSKKQPCNSCRLTREHCKLTIYLCFASIGIKTILVYGKLEHIINMFSEWSIWVKERGESLQLVKFVVLVLAAQNLPVNTGVKSLCWQDIEVVLNKQGSTAALHTSVR